MALCKAVTAAGKPCKKYAMEGSELCFSHGGKLLANEDGSIELFTVKHGFYKPTFSEEEYADLILYAEQFDLADELAVARVRLRRIVEFIDEHEGSLTADEYGRLNGLVFQAITTIHKIVKSLDGNGADHWDIVLNQLSIDLGMDL